MITNKDYQTKCYDEQKQKMEESIEQQKKLDEEVEEVKREMAIVEEETESFRQKIELIERNKRLSTWLKAQEDENQPKKDMTVPLGYSDASVVSMVRAATTIATKQETEKSQEKPREKTQKNMWNVSSSNVGEGTCLYHRALTPRLPIAVPKIDLPKKNTMYVHRSKTIHEMGGFRPSDSQPILEKSLSKLDLKYDLPLYKRSVGQSAVAGNWAIRSEKLVVNQLSDQQRNSVEKHRPVDVTPEVTPRKQTTYLNLSELCMPKKQPPQQKRTVKLKQFFTPAPVRLRKLPVIT